MKKGAHTTEFWMSLLAMILGFVMASGYLPETGMVVQIIGGAIAVLAKLGYTASRTSIKNTETLKPMLGTLTVLEDDAADPS